MIDARSLTRALGDRDLADWVLIERDLELADVDEASATRRVEHRTRRQLTVHVDVAAGRGSAHVEIDAVAGDAEVAVDQALALARASIGPAWRQAPPAAPARVPLADPELAGRDLTDAADRVLRALRRPPTTVARASVAREHVTVATHQGLHATWDATSATVTALVATADRSLEVMRGARRLIDLEVDAALADAAADLDLLSRAGPPAAGPCGVVLTADAMLHGDLGVWAVFEAQADAITERQGLTRYRERSPIAEGADLVPEPLSITSDGALPFGPRSAPLGDWGDAVRRFPLVDHGIAAALGLSPREAALRHREPNGGVRNLIVAPGSWSGETSGRIIEVRRLRDLAIDRYTGEASLEIALGLADGKPFAGGTLHLDLIAALARAHRNTTTLRRGPYRGPSAILIEHAELVV